MTKETANEIKNILKENKYSSRYYSPKETLIVDLMLYYDSRMEEYGGQKALNDRANNYLIKVLNILTKNGYRPKYELKKKRAQGFINIVQVYFN